jgi:hypothetical protein
MHRDPNKTCMVSWLGSRWTETGEQMGCVGESYQVVTAAAASRGDAVAQAARLCVGQIRLSFPQLPQQPAGVGLHTSCIALYGVCCSRHQLARCAAR